MGDYNLTGLNPRGFEHLVQALAKKYITSGVTPFGDGRDGGRKATFNGKMDYPSKTDPWEGYLVIQCKFLKKPMKDVGRDADWVIQQLTQELRKFASKDRDLSKPEHYLFVTNVELTAVPETGSKDRVFARLSEYALKLGMKEYDVWSYDELCRFIDDNTDIRQAYAGFITVGDVFSEVFNWLKPERPDFLQLMTASLQIELLRDCGARLESTAQQFDQQISLAQVFVDLPATDQEQASESFRRDSKNKPPLILATLLEAGSRVLRNSSVDLYTSQFSGAESGLKEPSKYVIVGGPGRGKSTIAQFLCQLYCTPILRNLSPAKLEPTVKRVINSFEERNQLGHYPLPEARRFPVRIALSQYASELAQNSDLTILQYICDHIRLLGSGDC